MLEAKRDAGVLGNILLLQSALHVASDNIRMAEILVAGIGRIPGVLSVQITHDNEPSENPASCIPGQSPSPNDPHSFSMIAGGHLFGKLTILVSDKGRFEEYRPFIQNTANLAALLMNTRHQQNLLEKVNRHLEHLVEERTEALRHELEERRQAEDALRIKTEELDRYFRTSLDLLCIADIKGNFRRVNPEWERTLGYTPKDLEGQSFLDLIHPDDLAKTQEAITVLAGKEEILNFINRYRAYNGEYRWIEWRSRPDGELIFAAARDITERIEAEAWRKQLTTAIEQTSEGLLIIGQEALVRYANPAFEKITGYLCEEVTGHDLRLLQGGEYTKEIQTQIREYLQDGGSWMGALECRRKNGDPFTAEIAISPVHDEKGNIVNYVALLRDITRETQLEAQLRQAQKMEAIGTLAGGIAHDFNNVLQIIAGSADMALLEIGEKSEAATDLQEILDAAERASSLVRQLLAFSRRQTMQYQAMDLNQLVNGLLRILQRFIGEQIVLETQLTESPLMIRADPSHIEQILLNLCINARDAMPQGGRLTISTQFADWRQIEAPPEQMINNAYCVLLTVADTGVGIPLEIQERIFDPFFTTKAVGKGTGLGLATVYGIVRQHGGMIRCQSEPGKGSIFQIYLSLLEHAEVENTPTQAKRPRDLLRGSETILIAEDDATVRHIAVRTLCKAGYRVMETSNGEEALAQFAAYGHDIDLVLLDVVMPRMSGPEAASKILLLDPHIPLLFTSGYDFGTLEAQIDLGPALNLLHKPYTPEKLLNQIRELLDASRISTPSDAEAI